MNNREIAEELDIHPDDFEWLFETKWHFEGKVPENYASQHMLHFKTKLSCWFQSPVRKVKKYYLYLINEFMNNQYILRRLFSTLFAQEVTCHKAISEDFVNQLVVSISRCVEEPEPDRSRNGYDYALEAIQEFTGELIWMDHEEGIAILICWKTCRETYMKYFYKITMREKVKLPNIYLSGMYSALFVQLL